VSNFIGLPPNISYVVISIRNKKGTTSLEQGTKLIHNLLAVTFEDNSLKTIGQRDLKSMTSHSAGVTTNENIIVCAWTKKPILSGKHIPIPNFHSIMKIVALQNGQPYLCKTK
jgi:hypothetical protein